MGIPNRSDTAPHPMSGMDAFAPGQIAELVRTRGVAKVTASPTPTFVLGILAGAFIALGGVFSTTVGAGSTLGFGPTRLLSGAAFSLGLILVVIAGAELFTGNNLIVMAVASRQATIRQLLVNWLLVYAGNFVGALSVAIMVTVGDWWRLGDGSTGASAVTIAAQKAALPFGVAFVRGILANALVCLAVWIATGGHSVVDKVFAIVPPITAFVAAGFEHSVANMYFLPTGLFLKNKVLISDVDSTSLTVGGFLHNLAASTLGNIVGGAVLVGLVYWFVYLWPEEHGPARHDPDP